MCGRFTLRTPANELAQHFGVAGVPEGGPRYNIAPSQKVLVIRPREGRLTVDSLTWGLIPSWSKEPKGIINARAETVATKPSFRSAFKSRRCLVIADGFYEWAKLDTRRKQPWFFRLKTDQPFAFAGLWEHWGDGDTAIETCALITGEPNELVRPVHDRMPVIIPPERYDLWLDTHAEPRQLLSLLVPYPADEMEAYPVTTKVNSPRSDGAELIAPA